MLYKLKFIYTETSTSLVDTCFLYVTDFLPNLQHRTLIKNEDHHLPRVVIKPGKQAQHPVD